MPVIAYIALGSNLGERGQFLDSAVARLRAAAGVVVRQVSTYRETEPVGGPAGQAMYLNAAVEVETSLSPCELLRLMRQVEEDQGRVRRERDGPRTLDLDLLLYGQDVFAIHEPDCELVVPHPRLHERLFVLEPLGEIAPLAVHPVLRCTVRDLLRRMRRPDLTGQRAVVTGSSTGIGRAIAEALAGAGAAVVVHGYRSPARLDEAAQACSHLSGGAATALLADLRDEMACARLVEQAWQLGPVDIWINNAGADILTGGAHQQAFAQKLEALWQVDVRATMLLARAAGELMHARGRGVIINMGWDQAETGMASASGELFAATKGAVMAFSRSLALSLAPAVRVNCLAPGWIRTAWGTHASQPWQERVLRETPLARWGTPEDVARTALWLASPMAAFITGQIIRVNGGAVR
jgi:2-amino-4-hydroxy-6-hydroxymethyldihydropteridine diphosphokinase